MADLTKNAILVTVRDRAKWTKFWDHKGYKGQKESNKYYFQKIQNFIKKY